MSRRAIRLVRARRDIVAAAVYLDEHSPQAAKRFLAAVEATIATVLATPGIGVERTYRNPRLAGVRMAPVRGFEKHLIFYRPTEEGIEVVRVLHGARDLERILKEER